MRILKRDMDADAGIGRARAAGHEGYTRSACHGTVCACHERHSTFLPAGNHVYGLMLMQPVEDLQEAFSGNSKNTVAPLLYKAFDQQTGGIGRSGLAHARASSAALPKRQCAER
ncbi:hypothetical protein GCM10022213_01990 [Parerythrobacter jejuensis]